MKQHEKIPCYPLKSLHDLIQLLKKSEDFAEIKVYSDNSSVVVSYFRTLIDVNMLQEDVLPYIKEKPFDSLQDIQAALPIGVAKVTKQIEDIQNDILNGYILIQIDKDISSCLLINISKKKAGILQRLKLNIIL